MHLARAYELPPLTREFLVRTLARPALGAEFPPRTPEFLLHTPARPVHTGEFLPHDPVRPVRTPEFLPRGLVHAVHTAEFPPHGPCTPLSFSRASLDSGGSAPSGCGKVPFGTCHA